MATKEGHYRIGQADFDAFDRSFGPALEEKRSLYHRNEIPLETVPSPFMVYRRTVVSQVPEWPFAPPPLPGPPLNFQFSPLFPANQKNPPKRMGEGRELPTVGPYQVQYPPQELYGNRPAAETATIDNVKAAQLYGGITRVNRYGRYK
ncbi:hypothetical protein CDL15_Pgr016723 [Punica granatum]|uniref:Uncharacterized protein n=1 Tax=Punica granatum TaxID=22663 RepID=A0A218XTJ7_PUNGR|nr:hypothetical protein CDL15_Pgr016723 [Punica granatum]